MHVGAEASGRDVDPESGESLGDTRDQRFGVLGCCSFEVGRTSAAAGVGVERELADDECGATDVEQAAVHHPVVVGMDAQVSDAVGEPIRVRLVVVMGDPDEDDDPGADPTHLGACAGVLDVLGVLIGCVDVRLGHTLDQSTHLRTSPWLRRASEYAAAMAPLPTKDVVSAGGVVVDDRPDGSRWVLLIVHRSMSGHPRWTLPKGGLEEGETPEQAGVREVREETGHTATIVAPLSTISYSFVWRPERVRYQKKVHYFLMRWDGLPPGERDDEAEHVEWVPHSVALLRLAHRNERELVEAVGPEAPVEA